MIEPKVVEEWGDISGVVVVVVVVECNFLNHFTF